MTWVKLDEVFPDHPKVVQAGPLGLALQVAALCYCNHYLTDGFIPYAAVRSRLDFHGITMDGEPVSGIRVAEKLVEVGMWITVAGGFRIHNYFEFQPSREEVLALREIRKAAGRKGGLAKAKQDAKQPSSKPPSKTSSKTEAKLYPVPVETPLTVVATGTGGRGVRGEGAASPSPATRSGVADSAAQVPKLSAQLRAEHAAKTLAAHGIDNGQPPPPATRDDVDPAEFEAERQRQLDALKATPEASP